MRATGVSWKQWAGKLGGTVAAGVTLALGTAAALAASSDRLHEYFDLSLLSGALGRSASGAVDTEGEGGTSPTALRPWEGLTLEPGPHELVYAQEGPRGWQDLPEPHGSLDPRATAELDAQTDYANPLDYHEVFAPPIAPYKRAMVHNQVERTPQGRYQTRLLSVGRQPLAVEAGAARAEEDLFEGSMLLRLESRAPVLIPSVAPNQRLLALRADPPVAVRILRDEAGNHWAEAAHDGLVRVRMSVAVPRTYFEGEFDLEASWQDFPAGLVPPLPAAAREAALRVVQNLRLRPGRRDMRPYEALYRLVEHFRNFAVVPLDDAGAGQADGSDLYEAIATGQAGVCRHRSLAFVITAQALGIPARYVFNEAHAFVEVYWPRLGWRRIDLGGSVDEVRVRQSGPPSRAVPSYHDGLPQPERYREQLRRLAEAQRAGSNAGTDDASFADAEGDGTAPQGRGEELAAPPPENAQQVAGMASGGAPVQSEPAAPGSDAQPGQAASTGTPAGSADTRMPVVVRLVSASAQEVVRGQRVIIHGELTMADGRGLMGLPVRLFLAPPLSRGASHYVNLTEVITGPAGLFSAEVTLRPDLAAGRWIVGAQFEGDANHGPAASPMP